MPVGLLTRLRKPPPDDIPRLNATLGAKIREDFGLWGDNNELLSACGAPDRYAETASWVIVQAVLEELQVDP